MSDLRRRKSGAESHAQGLDGDEGGADRSSFYQGPEPRGRWRQGRGASGAGSPGSRCLAGARSLRLNPSGAPRRGRGPATPQTLPRAEGGHCEPVAGARPLDATGLEAGSPPSAAGVGPRGEREGAERGGAGPGPGAGPIPELRAQRGPATPRGCGPSGCSGWGSSAPLCSPGLARGALGPLGGESAVWIGRAGERGRGVRRRAVGGHVLLHRMG